MNMKTGAEPRICFLNGQPSSKREGTYACWFFATIRKRYNTDNSGDMEYGAYEMNQNGDITRFVKNE